MAYDLKLNKFTQARTCHVKILNRLFLVLTSPAITQTFCIGFMPAAIEMTGPGNEVGNWAHTLLRLAFAFKKQNYICEVCSFNLCGKNESLAISLNCRLCL